MVSQEKIDKFIQKHASAFKALEEFEKTGKARIKKRMNFTIDRETANGFREYCRKNNLNMSAKLEDAMRSTLQKQ